ncbi:MAG: ribosomal protein S18-alanine N-acetyltransferase [Planctomycetales bacterium]|nr:ribosomal protein S18-alanine N-acetyltransferase [Planctomycetales bacterium]
MSYGNSSPRSVSKTRCDVQIRWMIRRDMSEVLDIERQCFEFAWSEEDFLCCLRQRNCIGMVAERQERIVGFMIYELLKSQLHVLNFAVAPWSRRQGVASQMVEKLVNKLSQQRRQEISLEVRETNLAAQLFFRSQGLHADGVLRGHYEDTEEDAYVMRYQLYPDDEQILPFVPRNRIARIGEDYDAEAA